MTTNSGQTSTRERIDPMLETLIKGLIETGSYPKAASRTEDAVTAALTEAYMVSLITPERAESQVSPFKTAILAAALAPAIAEVLAPKLAALPVARVSGDLASCRIHPVGGRGSSIRYGRGCRSPCSKWCGSSVSALLFSFLLFTIRFEILYNISFSCTNC